MLKYFGNLACAALFMGSQASGRDLIRPAELPPASYAGQQYVDTRGCLFLRTGAAGQIVWLPRVTREGAAICGYPPSGQQVPLAGKGAASPDPHPQDPAVTAPVAADALLVAVGSFAVAGNADTAAHQITALGLPVHRGSLVRRGKMLITVFAGPFATAEAAEAALRSARAAGFADALIVRY